MLSHTPPAFVGSLEPKGFKRIRSNSISGRLRSASELFDDGVINEKQKGVLKDMIIADDPKLSEVLNKMDHGDNTAIKGLIEGGVLDRKESIDILAEMDNDFEYMNFNGFGDSANNLSISGGTPKDASIFKMDADDFASFSPYDDGPGGINLSTIKPLPVTKDQAGSHGSGFGTMNELFEFNLFEDTGNDLSMSPQRLMSHTLHRDSISMMEDLEDLNDMKSLDAKLPKTKSFTNKNSATSAPIGIPGSGRTLSARIQAHQSARQRMPVNLDVKLESRTKQAKSNKTKQNKTGGRSKLSKQNNSTKVSGRHTNTRNSTQKSSTRGSLHKPDPNADENGESNVKKIGIYSPESRRKLIQRFSEKRKHRIWKKRVKYDVRKNFADSRLRVKGRFVKKEDEELLRDLMLMT